MSKKINLKPYVGDLKDLISHGSEPIEDYWFILFQGKPYSINFGKASGLHRSEALAKAALKKYILCQFIQGHYWHKGKNNTFEHERVLMKPSANHSVVERELKQMSIELTEWLLSENIFEIKQLLK